MKQNKTLGIILTIISAVTITVVSTFFRTFFSAHSDVSVFTYNFFRGLGGVVLMPALFVTRGQSITEKRNFDVSRTTILLVRSIIGVAGNTSMILAMAGTKVSTFNSIAMLFPMLTVVLAHFRLGEKASTADWIAVFGSVTSSFFVTKPFSGGDKENSTLGLVALICFIFCASTAQTLNRQMEGMFALEVVMTAQAIGVLFLSPLLQVLIFGKEKTEFFSLLDFPLILLFVVVQYAGQFVVNLTARVAPLSQTAPFRYIQIVFGLTVGYFFLEEHVDFYDVLGSLGILSFNLLRVLSK